MRSSKVALDLPIDFYFCTAAEITTFASRASRASASSMVNPGEADSAMQGSGEHPLARDIQLDPAT